MATSIEPLVVDPQSRFLEMKSLQPYSTTDEYLYAMKEDLADWLSNMYPEWCPITADTFVECLENGGLLCQHANNVNDAARKAYALKLATPTSSSSLENCKYRSDARPQTFNARDNVSQFIKWARRVVGVREVLMFESDDLILRKNEKNFILCLLEIARYGARFGVSVPAIIKLENEIEREIERDKQTEILSFTELQRLQRETNNNNSNKTTTTITSNSIANHGKYSKLLQFNRSESLDSNTNDETSSVTSSPSSPKNSYNTFSFSNSNGANWLRQRISRIPKFTNNYLHNGKRRQSSEESNTSTTCSDVTTTMTPSGNNTDQQVPQISRTLGEGEMPEVPPASASQLHKTVVQIANSCCCAQRFPVIRIGEGKYRIGESGTIIFIRILRYHVMVRVGGGWDTLENYLNKHDPCRGAGHRRSEHNHHNADVPILAVPNIKMSSTNQKQAHPGKSVILKTEEFPLSRPSNHDTDLNNAQLVITRDADGRHRIGQITYKSEDDILNQNPICPHHHHPTQSPKIKIKSARGTGRISSSNYNKQSSPSTDQDYSSYTEITPTSNETTDRTPSDSKENLSKQSNESLNLTILEPRHNKPYSPIHRSQTQPIELQQPTIHINDRSVDDTDLFIESIRPKISPPYVEKISHDSTSITHEIKQTPTVVNEETIPIVAKYTSNVPQQKLRITESIIDTIDKYRVPTSDAIERDFDLTDVDDIMRNNKHDHDTTNMDEDSLNSCEGVLDEKPVITPPRPAMSTKKPVVSTGRPGGYCTALYLAQKQKFQQEQAAARQKSAAMVNPPSRRPVLAYSRSTTLPNVVEAIKKEEEEQSRNRRPISMETFTHQHRKDSNTPTIYGTLPRKSSATATRRCQSSELFEKTQMNSDMSKLDRDSGFDEQDFRRERLHSGADDNSSVSSIRSGRSSTARSLSIDTNSVPYRENKASELRLKARDFTRNLNEQDSRIKSRRNINSGTMTRGNEIISTPLPSSSVRPGHKYRKNSQQNFYLNPQKQQQDDQVFNQ